MVPIQLASLVSTQVPEGRPNKAGGEAPGSRFRRRLKPRRGDRHRTLHAIWSPLRGCAFSKTCGDMNELAWMEPEDRWLARRSTCGSGPIRLVRMGSERTTSRRLAIHRQFHPDELDGAVIWSANFRPPFSMQTRSKFNQRKIPGGKSPFLRHSVFVSSSARPNGF